MIEKQSLSSHDQKADLERKKQLLEMFCASNGWKFEIISDLGSGMNYHKKGLKKLLEEILGNDVGRLVITHKDRLLRFGAELIFADRWFPRSKTYSCCGNIKSHLKLSDGTYICGHVGAQWIEI